MNMNNGKSNYLGVDFFIGTGCFPVTEKLEFTIKGAIWEGRDLVVPIGRANPTVLTPVRLR